MNILMMTNTYIPHVGGVARSVASFTDELRRRGHRVGVVAPEYEEPTVKDADTVRIRAIQHFNGSDFSVVLPVPLFLESHLANFKPDLIHSHHPFFMGSTAIRAAAKYNVPLVYTHHTMFEEYTHYAPIEFPKLKKFIVSLSTGYANMADQVIAPSESTADILRQRGVTKPIAIVPTGIDCGIFERGDGSGIRARAGIEAGAFVAGHVGRLAPEKNLEFLSEAVAAFLRKAPAAHFIVAGYGPSGQQMEDFFSESGLGAQVHFLGKMQQEELGDVYHAMDAFVFTSKTETQGLVVLEAMCAGVPVVALDAPGVREVVRDGENGLVPASEEKEEFADALLKLSRMQPQTRKALGVGAKRTGKRCAVSNCTSRLLKVYERLLKQSHNAERDESVWERSIEQVKREWDLLSNLTSAVGDAMSNHVT